MARPITPEVSDLYNEEVRSTWSSVPALVMVALMVLSPLFTALGIVHEKETGSIYNVSSAPVSRIEFLAGKLAPYVLISILNVIILWLMAILIFKCRSKGIRSCSWRHPWCSCSAVPGVA